MAGPIYFAWTAQGEPFSNDLIREDEEIFEFEISQSEGDFATLRIDILNPYIGILAPGRLRWCWLSWDDGTGTVHPLFNGQVIGAAEAITGEVIRLQFRARPVDYIEKRQALSNSLKILPYYDPAFIDQTVDDPIVALEARTVLFHIGRTDLQVSVSDILNGEDGTIEVSVSEDEHFYDMSQGYNQTPIRSITCIMTNKWQQTATGEVDITKNIYDQFKFAGSPFPYPMVGSFSSDGLLSDWPKPLTNLGGGWEFSENSQAIIADYYTPWNYNVRYSTVKDNTTASQFKAATPMALTLQQIMTQKISFGGPLDLNTGPIDLSQPQTDFSNWDLSIPLVPIYQQTILRYTASRDRSEILTFTLTADTQPILTDTNSEDVITIALNSDTISQPVDPGGALPVFDVRRNSYFPTPRGQQSLQFGLLLARARIVARSRAVKLGFVCQFAKMATIVSCRKNVLISDYRFPASQAIGKIISYTLLYSGTGEATAGITIGCAIGYGNPLDQALTGNDTYSNHYARRYTRKTDAQVDVLVGELQYDDLSGTYVLDDDGVDFFNMTPQSVLSTLVVTNGPNDQTNAIDEGLEISDPLGRLKGTPTTIRFSLVPVDGGAFQTIYNVVTSPLVIPKMIDLEAEAV